MNTQQKIILAAMLVAVVAWGIYQSHQASQLREQIQTLQQQQASLKEQFQQSKIEREKNAHPTARAHEEKQPPADNSETAHRSSTNAAAAHAALLSATLERDLAAAHAEPTAGRREIALKKIRDSISLNDIPRAMAFLAKNPGMDGVQSPLFAALASKWGEADANAATAWAKSLTDADARKAATVGVMKGWTDKAPETAAAYAAALSPPDLQEAAVMQVINEWSFWHADGAANWVAQFPAGKLRDKAMGPIVFWGSGECPATVADMLDATGNPEIIRQYGENVATVWLDRDPPAARAWIEHSPLAEDVKSRLLKPKE